MLDLVTIIYCTLVSYVIAGLSTSDITRLLKGAKHDILESNCYCMNCGYVIPLNNQFPIFSYLFNKGKCRNCHKEITKIQFVQEFFLFTSFTIINVLTRFEPKSVIINFLIYEVFKFIVITLRGRRENQFLKQLIISIVINILMFTLVYLFLHLFQFIIIILFI
jgi:prepilin signal peptidase PulO-like enzyme (type II secretory pathway)